MTKQALEDVEQEIKALRAEIGKINARLGRKIAKRDDLFVQQNQKNYSSIEWLVNNPNTPGHFEAMRDWMKQEFGSEYNGVVASGYYPRIGQQSFGFMVLDCDGDEKPEYIENIKKFVDVVLPYLKPVEEDMVFFTYATGEYSGNFDIKYKFGDATWWTSNTVYGLERDVKPHGSLDDAIKFAQKQAAQIDD